MEVETPCANAQILNKPRQARRTLAYKNDSEAEGKEQLLSQHYLRARLQICMCL